MPASSRTGEQSADRRWRRGRFQLVQPGQRVVASGAAHRRRRVQSGAARRAQRAGEDRAAEIIGQLRAAHARRLALRHARDGARNRRRNAARAAGGAAGEGGRTRVGQAAHRGQINRAPLCRERSVAPALPGVALLAQPPRTAAVRTIPRPGSSRAGRADPAGAGTPSREPGCAHCAWRSTAPRRPDRRRSTDCLPRSGGCSPHSR